MPERPRYEDRLMTPAEVATLFQVHSKTVTRWGDSGHLSTVRTPGGHRRFLESEVQQFLGGGAR